MEKGTIINHSRTILADLHWQRSIAARQVFVTAWKASLWCMTIGVWTLFIICIMSESGGFGAPLQ